MAALRANALAQALRELRGWQRLGAATGSLHAAAWVDWQGRIQLVREDVGRHNALDKVIGALLEQRRRIGRTGFLIVTSRASYEMVQKAATAGVRMLVAVSAPTALAVRLAEQTRTSRWWGLRAKHNRLSIRIRNE